MIKLSELKEEIAEAIYDVPQHFTCDDAARRAIDIIQPHWDEMRKELVNSNKGAATNSECMRILIDENNGLESELERLDATLTAKIDRAVEALEWIKDSTSDGWGKSCHAHQALKELRDEDE